MLEHVALNQTRFNTPGVAPDNRGFVRTVSRRGKRDRWYSHSCDEV